MKSKKVEDVMIDQTMPHQINAPSFKGTSIKVEKPFVNQHGVVIGDSFYDSKHSPLNQWSDETDPAIMAGDEWVHPTNDIGWNAKENQELLEKQREVNHHDLSTRFMHPTKDVSYSKD
ncbi:MAG TPA: DUF3905 domain-containing protein [Massilibacterium sp.]|nr:DUF3905 domain-containing protein [Massilibacterium sp.]